jgi:DNA-directed RNA polymerase specialized sigma24 family protein
MTRLEVRMETSHSLRPTEPFAFVSAWPESTLAARRARRPRGWQSTPMSLLSRAKQGDPGAVSSLCGKYWQAVQSYLQLRGASQSVADDATQGCFERLLKIQALSTLELEPADSFGAWLASRAWYFLRNHWKQEKKHRPLPLGAALERRQAERQALLLADQRVQLEERQQPTPEQSLDQDRALALLEGAFARLRPEYEALGQALLFDHLRATLLREASNADLSDAELRQRLGYCRSYVAGARHRLKWVELPAALRALQDELARERRQPGVGPQLRGTSARQELRALADALT